VLEQGGHLAQGYLPAAGYDAVPPAEIEKDRVIWIHALNLYAVADPCFLKFPGAEQSNIVADINIPAYFFDNTEAVRF